jgi:hypothetical protein
MCNESFFKKGPLSINGKKRCKTRVLHRFLAFILRGPKIIASRFVFHFSFFIDNFCRNFAP